MISGLCDICNQPGQTNTCNLCGKRVCKTHYDHERGICSSCKRGKV